MPLGDVVKADLVPVRVELRLNGSERALVRHKSWLWPGLRDLTDGLIFESDAVPTNFAIERSRHVTFDRTGRLCLDADAAYEKALISFFVSPDRVEFELPRPGVGMSFTDVEGTSTPLRIGEPLVLRDEDKGGSLNIRCSDKFAKLDIRGRLEQQPFARSPTRVLSIADLMTPASRDEVILQSSRTGSVPLTLTRVVPALSPTAFTFERVGDAIVVTLEMRTDVDAVRFELEDELGNRTNYECALMHRPVAGHCPPWLDVALDFSNYRRAIITVSQHKYSGEISLAQLLVRPAGENSFRPLRKLRGDIFAMLVRPMAKNTISITDAALLNTSKRYSTNNTWMLHCYAKECWDTFGGIITDRWITLGKQLSGAIHGNNTLLASAHLPPQPGSAKSWVPLAHPLQFVPDLYGLPLETFHVLGTETADGADHLALLSEAAGRSIPELHQVIGLSPAFLPAFDNFLRAQVTNEELTGFKFAKYALFFAGCDTDPGARWFWQPGDTLLGPDHYGAAIGSLIERAFEAGLEQDGFNDICFRQAASLASEARKAQEKTLPIPQSIQGTDVALIEWVPAFYSAFARHSREGKAENYLRHMSTSLGRSYKSVVSDATFLIRLGPELLAFYLLLWELTKVGRRS